MIRRPLSLLFWVGLALSVACERAPGNRRNVLMVVVDTVRADRLSPYGSIRATTPHLERQASSSGVFTRAYASSSWTLPSFGTLLTGRWMSRHNAGISVEFQGGDVKLARLDDSVFHLAESLQTAGYSTAAFVNNPFLNPNLGLDRGFDLYDYAHADNLTLRRADRMTDRVLDWFAHQAQDPWFALVHLFDPHMDYDPPDAFRGRFTEGVETRLSYPVSQLQALREGRMELSDDDREFIKGAYDEEIAFVDQELGRLLTGLRESGRLEDTVVIITSDHGEELFDHGGFEHGHTLYQEVLHIPLLISGPQVQPQRCDDPVSLVDLAATVLEALALPSPESDGESLWGKLTRDESIPSRPVLAEGVLYGATQRAIVEWPYKLVVEKDGPVLGLYRLDQDPRESNNLAPVDPARVETLRGQLDGLLKAAAKERVQENMAELTPEVRERLRALGYID